MKLMLIWIGSINGKHQYNQKVFKRDFELMISYSYNSIVSYNTLVLVDFLLSKQFFTHEIPNIPKALV